MILIRVSNDIQLESRYQYPTAFKRSVTQDLIDNFTYQC